MNIYTISRELQLQLVQANESQFNLFNLRSGTYLSADRNKIFKVDRNDPAHSLSVAFGEGLMVHGLDYKPRPLPL